MSNIVEESAITNGEGLMEYEQIMHVVETKIPFKGKTLSQWSEEIKLPYINHDMTLHQLEEFNHLYVNNSYLVMDALASARAGLHYTKNHMEISILREKKAIESRIIQWNSVPTNTPKRKIPSKDTLNDRAMEMNAQAISAHRVAEVFYEFFKTHHEKLKIIGDRLTGMNILKNIESKYVH
jgi:hypothetical protein